ncbi:MAG: GGDEF domain-containing protein [Anaeroplasmataceae bacterium]
MGVNYNARIPNVTIKLNSDLEVLEVDRGFLRFFNFSEFKGDFFSLLPKEDVNNFKNFLLNYNDSQLTKSFITTFHIRDNDLTSVLYVDKVNDIYEISIKEMEYTKERYHDNELLKQEYASVLSSIDSYYFLYNIEKKCFALKNTKNLLSIYEGDLIKLKELLIDFFKIKEEEKNSDMFKELCHDLESSVADKDYTFEKNKGKVIFSTKKTISDKKEYIVSSIFSGENEMVKQASYLESHDALTSLYNKKTITEMAISRINKAKLPCTIIVIDIDRFKEFNDSYGHQYGDSVLKAMGQVLKDSLGSLGYAGRIGGDEFMCIVEGTDEDDLRNITRNIKIGIQWAIPTKTLDQVITCSIGCARFPLDGKKYNDIFELADKCLYIAKNKGRNCYVIYKPEIHEAVLSKSRLEQEKIIEGTLYTDYAREQMEILSILDKKEENYKEKVIAKLRNYLNVSKIVLYDQDFNPIIINGVDDNDYRKIFLNNKDYFKYFNKENYFILDNVQSLEPIDKIKCKMYQNNSIASTLEILGKENDKIKGLITIDLYKPARTFNPIHVVFSLMVAKKIFNE